MAAPDVDYSDENTALKSSKNKKSDGNQRYGTAATSFDSVNSAEGLTPSGYEVNWCQLPMILSWLTLGIIPHLAALIVGFERDDIKCNDYNNYGWIHPRAYLKITGIVGIIISIIGTLIIYYWISYNHEPLEMIVNGKLFEFQHPMHPQNGNGNGNIRKHKYNMILNKLMAYSIIIASFIWDIIGWSLVSKLNYNGCSDELVTQTILAWTIINMLLLICALSSRFVKRSKQLITDSEADFHDQEEGSVDQII